MWAAGLAGLVSGGLAEGVFAGVAHGPPGPAGHRAVSAARRFAADDRPNLRQLVAQSLGSLIQPPGQQGALILPPVVGQARKRTPAPCQDWRDCVSHGAPGSQGGGRGDTQSMNTEVIVTCAVTGAGDTVGKHPAIPVTPKQIADAAIEAAKAGAAVAHIHVRDPQDRQGQPRSGALPRRWCERVRSSDTDVVINLTAGMGGDFEARRRRARPRSAPAPTWSGRSSG